MESVGGPGGAAPPGDGGPGGSDVREVRLPIALYHDRLHNVYMAAGTMGAAIAIVGIVVSIVFCCCAFVHNFDGDVKVFLYMEVIRSYNNFRLMYN